MARKTNVGAMTGDLPATGPAEVAVSDIVRRLQPPQAGPVRIFFVHKKCNKETKLGSVLAQSYARDKPTDVYCIPCGKPVPVEEVEFR